MELPVWNRTFTTDLNFGNGSPDIVSRNWTGLGDIRLKGIYTGFSEDLSSGLTFGVKLPTGSDSHDPDVVDRDTQISSGSTDLLLGGFHRARFGNSQLELVRAGGTGFAGAEAGRLSSRTRSGRGGGNLLRRPFAGPREDFAGGAGHRLLARTRQRFRCRTPDDSGYQRVLLSPGIEFHLHPVKYLCGRGNSGLSKYEWQPARGSGIGQGEPELYVLKCRGAKFPCHARPAQR